MAELQFVCNRSDLVETLKSKIATGTNSALTFGIKQDGILFPVFLNLDPDTNDRLLALYNGAVARNRSESGIVFQRSSWADEIDANVIGFADPTLLLNKSLSLGWGQTNGIVFAPQVYADVLNSLREAGIVPSAPRTLHYGSSAGGFQAVATSAFDRDSRALVNNPQLDWSQYSLKWAANGALRILGFENRDAYLASDKYAEISSRIELPMLFKKLDYIPTNLRILVNAASEGDIVTQIQSLITGVRKHAGEQMKHYIKLDIYFNESQGHNPLPKPRTLEFIAEELQRIEPSSL